MVPEITVGAANEVLLEILVAPVISAAVIDENCVLRTT
jgi:hypothetical protein